MNNNIIDTGKATNGQFTVTYQSNGNGAAIPVINGKECRELMFGYVSETDRKGCLKLISDALKATDGDIYKAIQYMYNAALTAAKEIKADEAVMVDDVEIIISYETKSAYVGTEKIADLADVTCELPNEAIKAMLVDRVKLYCQQAREDYEDDIDEWFDEY